MTATANEELAFAGPVALAKLVRERQIKPRELVELCLRRIEAIDPGLNAFRVTLADEALAAADAAADTIPDGPLAGVPIAVKDDTPVARQSVTRGSRSYGPPASAANGVTRNPWNPQRTPGGSSGGSAAAVAAGMVPCATGSDGGGSIRIPAACCGLVGMKPTRGRVSSQPASEGWLGLSTFGALARSVADSAMLLDVIHGSLPGDAYVAPPFEGSYLQAAATPPGRLRIAVSRKLPPGFMAWLSADQRGAFERMGALLSELGHEVVQRNPSYGPGGIEFTQMWLRGIAEESAHVPDHSVLEPSTRQLVAAGRRLISDRRREKLLVQRAARTARVLELWQEVDVLLTPVLAGTAIAAEGAYGKAAPLAMDRASRFMPYNPLFNVTGQPSIALPAGFGADGLPLSVQLVGRPGAEDLLYSLAGQIEAARPWGQHRPRV